MGVVYKLTAEVKDYILEQKRGNAILSCRNLSVLAKEHFRITISKSSVNSIIKAANLSMPVGRRLKKRRRRSQTPSTAIPTETQIKRLADSSAKFSLLTQKPDKHLPQLFVSPHPVPLPIEEEAKKESLPPPLPLIKKEKNIIFYEDTAITTGAILLKAADCLIRGSNCISNLICAELKLADRDFLKKTEALLYAPLFDTLPYANINSDSSLWPLIGQKFPPQELLAHLTTLQKSTILPAEILHLFPCLFQEVRGTKVELNNQTTLYIDAQCRSLWSTPYTPYDFSLPSYEIRRHINNYIRQNLPLVFFTAPQDELIPEEFLDFILSFPPQGTNSISSLTLYGNQLQEIDVLRHKLNQQGYFVFGLWPWQYPQYRTIHTLTEFSPFYFPPLEKEFYITSVEINLKQPKTNAQVTLKGCAVKTNLQEKERLFILSNLPGENLEQLVSFYLSRWPNLEQTFQDHNRKIERYTYTGNCESSFSKELLKLSQISAIDINGLFQHYLNILNAYVLWQFLPSDYEYKDFPAIKERFYNLTVTIKQQSGHLEAIFHIPEGFIFIRDLEYTCQRLNEKEIKFNDGEKIWFSYQMSKD